ncbi:hypothetical protein HDV05_001164, partial [Chytridiales sp. JEL 0842]
YPHHPSPPSVAYLATEQRFPINRFYQIARERKANLQKLGERVHLIHLQDLETQEHIISYQLPALIQKKNIKLIILDSVAANFRGGDNIFSPQEPTTTEKTSDVKEAADRALQILKLAQTLKVLAHTYSLAILCINQVTADMNNKSKSTSCVVSVATGSNDRESKSLLAEEGPRDEFGEFSSLSSGSGVSPTLGAAWGACVNMRVMLTRNPLYLPTHTESSTEGDQLQINSLKT